MAKILGFDSWVRQAVGHSLHVCVAFLRALESPPTVQTQAIRLIGDTVQTRQIMDLWMDFRPQLLCYRFKRC